MVSEQGLHFDAEFGVLLCRFHGFAVHPTCQAITRHLRGQGHKCRGEALKRAVQILSALPLKSFDELGALHPSRHNQPIRPIPNLRILDGWSCKACDGECLTTSLELVKRHATAAHGRGQRSPPLWEECRLQTFFQETKYRRYFRVFDDRGDDPAETNELTVVGIGRGNHARRGLLRAELRHERPSATGILDREAPLHRLSVEHPMVYLSKRHIPWLSSSYLDRLFKAGKWMRPASIPLFNPNHIDSEHNMQTIFPGCDREPLFFHALLYSMVRFANYGTADLVEKKLLQATVALLNEKLSCASQVGSPAVVGSILLLKGTAYKLGDLPTHIIHKGGLATVLQYFDESNLSVETRKAMFWEDLFASALLSCTQRMRSMDMFTKVHWRRESDGDASLTSLPAGFARHKALFPPELLDCIVDLVEMKSHLRKLADLPPWMRQHTIESMQVSIEARIVHQTNCQSAPDAIVEATRCAVHLCCYGARAEVWRDSMFPQKLGEKLLGVLEPTLRDEGLAEHWSSHPDLMLWLLLILSSVRSLDWLCATSLNARRTRLLEMVKARLSERSFQNVESSLQSALQDYVHIDTRCSIETLSAVTSNWDELESSIEEIV